MDYLGTPEALDEFFTVEACKALGEHSRSIGLEPNVFVFQDFEWNACCCEKRENCLKYFERLHKRRNGPAAKLYPLWCLCLAERLPESLIPRLRRLSKAIICRPATVLSERLGNLDGKLPQVPANRQKIWAAPIKPKRNPCLVNRPRLCGQYKKPLCRKY